jgi:hypothetical protein
MCSGSCHPCIGTQPAQETNAPPSRYWRQFMQEFPQALLAAAPSKRCRAVTRLLDEIHCHAGASSQHSPVSPSRLAAVIILLLHSMVEPAIATRMALPVSAGYPARVVPVSLTCYVCCNHYDSCPALARLERGRHVPTGMPHIIPDIEDASIQYQYMPILSSTLWSIS